MNEDHLSTIDLNSSDASELIFRSTKLNLMNDELK